MRIRDAVEKQDIVFSKIEERIIRTQVFQRLGRIKQLGTTFYVYPMATHTRFAHSLGTCAMVKKIMRERESDERAEYNFRFKKDEKEIICLAALLHDISQVPFGHILEDESDVIKKHDSKERYEEFLLKKEEICNILGKERAKEIIKILTEKSDNLSRPYQSELIKDTISADLLDYLSRDALGTGLLLGWDKRILQYLKISRHAKKLHLVIDAMEGGVKNQDVISEVERLLQSRYFLAERAYFYHTKLAADAMIIKAVKEASLSSDLLTASTDDEILLYLRDKSKSCVANSLASQIWERKLFKTAYMIDKQTLEERSSESVASFSKEYFGREKASAIENKLISGTNFKYEDIIVFCLPPDMNMKVANALIRVEKGTVRAKTLPGFREINAKHENLWRLYVFVKAGMEDVIARKCERVFRLPNQWNFKNRTARGLCY